VSKLKLTTSILILLCIAAAPATASPTWYKRSACCSTGPTTTAAKADGVWSWTQVPAFPMAWAGDHHEGATSVWSDYESWPDRFEGLYLMDVGTEAGGAVQLHLTISGSGLLHLVSTVEGELPEGGTLDARVSIADSTGGGPWTHTVESAHTTGAGLQRAGAQIWIPVQSGHHYLIQTSGYARLEDGSVDHAAAYQSGQLYEVPEPSGWLALISGLGLLGLLGWRSGTRGRSLALVPLALIALPFGCVPPPPSETVYESEYDPDAEPYVGEGLEFSAWAYPGNLNPLNVDEANPNRLPVTVTLGLVEASYRIDGMPTCYQARTHNVHGDEIALVKYLPDGNGFELDYDEETPPLTEAEKWIIKHYSLHGVVIDVPGDPVDVLWAWHERKGAVPSDCRINASHPRWYTIVGYSGPQ
jgi:hypothetical protein